MVVYTPACSCGGNGALTNKPFVGATVRCPDEFHVQAAACSGSCIGEELFRRAQATSSTCALQLGRGVTDGQRALAFERGRAHIAVGGSVMPAKLPAGVRALVFLGPDIEGKVGTIFVAVLVSAAPNSKELVGESALRLNPSQSGASSSHALQLVVALATGRTRPNTLPIQFAPSASCNVLVELLDTAQPGTLAAADLKGPAVSGSDSALAAIHKTGGAHTWNSGACFPT
mmetsp:Transcript_39261/g.77209  ORF Transcript_39261/g.77209 Transcript_39261/m.77209 type:complete len:230 (-) Transcript_39261:941-1630(-)